MRGQAHRAFGHSGAALTSDLASPLSPMYHSQAGAGADRGREAKGTARDPRAPRVRQPQRPVRRAVGGQAGAGVLGVDERAGTAGPWVVVRLRGQRAHVLMHPVRLSAIFDPAAESSWRRRAHQRCPLAKTCLRATARCRCIRPSRCGPIRRRCTTASCASGPPPSLRAAPSRRRWPSWTRCAKAYTHPHSSNRAWD